MAPIALAITAAIGAVTSAVSIATRPQPPQAPNPVTNQTEQARAQEEAARAQAQALQKRRGLAATTLTSPLGTTGSTNTQSATLGT